MYEERVVGVERGARNRRKVREVKARALEELRGRCFRCGVSSYFINRSRVLGFGFRVSGVGFRA